VVALPEAKGLILEKGTIVDSTIIAAPSSPKNREKKRDPEAHQTKKGNTAQITRVTRGGFYRHRTV